MKHRILLVGGSGYLGSHLRKHLDKNFDVSITGTKKRNDLKYYQIDFLDPNTYSSLLDKKFELVILLSASLKGLGKIDLNNSDLIVNTVKFATFLQFLSDKNLTKKIIYISSMTVYSVSAISPVEEFAPLSPLSTYGLSKKNAESIIDFFAYHGKIKALILRLPGIYGGMRRNGYIYNTISKALKNDLINIDAAGLGYWECIEVNDLCNLIGQLINSFDWKENCEILNVGYGEQTDFIQTANIIVDELKSKSKIVVENREGYTNFYMSNRKLLKFANPANQFFLSLQKYIQSCKDELYCR